ncbi:anti-sigma-28 factor FlgM [Methylophaga lonarensis MPL]|uniref:Negative regulator of flagellin synthesis n=1 Tax=Methylophaga lonarensis MPL TaxID=1286106 RepID=M7NY62_9GAMM|nr:flagellar biosynthesis anti-sigma factor FlgM [Methylophaga lonarensis]EMR13743.1 anti-sigma-28 factor FlgM [Methylophaga lonarensis MPL]
MSEINNIKSSGQPSLIATRNPNADNNRGMATSTTEQSNSNADKVSLTDTASQLQSLQRSVADLPQVDVQRVEALRAAIADGSYQVDSEKLARNMIDLEGQL